MYLFLESQDVLSLDKVTALVKDGQGTAIYKDDGSVLKSLLRPETLARRCFPSPNYQGEIHD